MLPVNQSQDTAPQSINSQNSHSISNEECEVICTAIRKVVNLQYLMDHANPSNPVKPKFPMFRIVNSKSFSNYNASISNNALRNILPPTLEASRNSQIILTDNYSGSIETLMEKNPKEIVEIYKLFKRILNEPSKKMELTREIYTLLPTKVFRVIIFSHILQSNLRRDEKLSNILVIGVDSDNRIRINLSIVKAVQKSS